MNPPRIPKSIVAMILRVWHIAVRAGLSMSFDLSMPIFFHTFLRQSDSSKMLWLIQKSNNSDHIQRVFAKWDETKSELYYI